MFKRTVWRNRVSDAVSFHQDEALNTTMFLLKTLGPTGFILQEEGEARNLKVCLGDPHTCTCPVFTKDLEPCKHICWILLRKFRIPREHKYSFQHGLVERQILEVLHGLHQTQDHRTESDPSAASGTPSQAVSGQEAGSVCRKEIQAQDVCPICQEELLEKKQPVSYCRFSCGNNVHVSCMKVWADHQRLSDRQDTVKCPLCREDFSSLKLLLEQVKNAAKLFTAAEREKPDRHLGVPCSCCRVCPITGKCFKCTVCSHFYLCEGCSQKGCGHPQHPLASRTKRTEKWRFVAEDLNDEPMGVSAQSACDSSISAAADALPETMLSCLEVVRVRSGSRLLDVGQQCRICLLDFKLGQRVRILPCRHKFHTDCVDGILRKSNSCPLDGSIIYNPLTWRNSVRNTSPKLSSCLSSDCGGLENNFKDLFVPGVALQDRNTTVTPTHDCLNSQVFKDSPASLNPQKKLLTDSVTKQGRPEPKHSTSFSVSSKSDSCALPSRKTATHHSPASPNRCAAVPQVELFVGSQRSQSEHTKTAAFPSRPAQPQPKRTGGVTVRHTNTLMSELTMTGVMINPQQQRKEI